MDNYRNFIETFNNQKESSVLRTAKYTAMSNVHEKVLKAVSVKTVAHLRRRRINNTTTCCFGVSLFTVHLKILRFLNGFFVRDMNRHAH